MPNNPGRSHIFIHNMIDPVVHNIKYATIRYMGPRQADLESYSLKVQGRYALHFHHCFDNSAGGEIEGVVVRDCGSPFVPHSSHGLTFTNCISYNIYENAYWWDPQGSGALSNAKSDDIQYDGCIAALVKCDPSLRGYAITGFLLGIGENTSVVNSVATGVQGSISSSGFQWPADANGQEYNVWVFDNNVSHNNSVNGAYIWQNDTRHHVIENFIVYRNNGKGIEHGAYNNVYLWKNNHLIGNGTGNSVSTGPRTAWLNHNMTWDITSGAEGRYTVRDMYMDGEDKSPYAFYQTTSSASAVSPSLMLRWTVKNYTDKAIRISETAHATRKMYMDFVDWTVGTGGELEPSDFLLQSMAQNSRIRVQRRDGTAYQITSQAGSTTTFDIVSIPAFYPY